MRKQDLGGGGGLALVRTQSDFVISGTDVCVPVKVTCMGKM